MLPTVLHLLRPIFITLLLFYFRIKTQKFLLFSVLNEKITTFITYVEEQFQFYKSNRRVSLCKSGKLVD